MAHPLTATAADWALDLAAAQSEIIDLIAGSAPFSEILARIAAAVERLVAPVRCSILLLDEAGQHLRHGAAPSLPEGYNRAVDGIAIGPQAGSCGTAVHRRAPVIVRDIASDPLWAEFRHLALAHGLRACWSLPVIEEGGATLGAVALYCAEPREPEATEWRLIEAMARLVRLALVQQRTGATLRRSEFQHRMLAEHASDVIIRIALGGERLYVSPSVKRMLGYEPDELVGGAGFALLHPDDAAETQTVLRGLVTGGPPAAVTHRVRRKGGDYIWVEFVARQVAGPDGRAEIVGIVRDMTARRAAEDKLRQSETRYRLLAEHASDVIMHKVLNGPRLYVSPSVRQLLGYHPEDLVTGTSLDLVHPDDADRVRAATEALTPDGPSAVLQYRMRHKDGSFVWIEATMRLVSGSDGRRELIGAMRDIRERRRAEEELAEANRRLAEENRRFNVALENARHGLAFYNVDWCLQVWNRPYTDMLGLPPDALHSGMTLTDVLRTGMKLGRYPNADPDAAFAERMRIASKATTETFHLRMRDGRVLEAVQQAPVDGGRVVTVTDVTERMQHEARLHAARDEAEAANRTKSEFLATMSHELRTPLNAILGFSEIIRDACVATLDQRYRDYANDIHTSGQHLLELINDILDLSKVEVGRLELHEEAVDVRQVVSRCCRLVADRAHRGGVSIGVQVADDLPSVLADGLRLKQILLNLLTNAVKFTPAGGRVVIDVTTQDGEGLEIAVSDTGIGMRPEEIPIALAPFRQIDNARSRRYEGTGLGLPLAKRMVELHGGALHIESESGRGTTVRARLPDSRVLRGTTALLFGSGTSAEA